MTLPVNALKLAYRTVSFKLQRRHSDPTNDYNHAAATYDQYYSQHLGPSAQTLVDKLPLRAGMSLLDLACGTGFFSHQLARAAGPSGHVRCVDISPGMLEQNRLGAAARGYENLSFLQSDAMQALRETASASLDGVVCGWGICYLDHAAFRAEVERVLRPRGFLGIIENRQNTLKRVSDLFRRVLLTYPEAIVKNIAIDLPRDAGYLVKTLCRGELMERVSWDSEVDVPCDNGAAVADYIVKSGAGAGFLDALDPAYRERVLRELSRVIDRELLAGRAVPVTHTYCVLLAERS